MKKKGLLMILGLVLGLALIASPAMALNFVDHVTVAKHMQGDLLVYPVYIAGSGLETRFHVVNSSDYNSVVAKVVLRSHKYSQEVLDFLIYLSPNDYFDATIGYLNGKIVLTSTDDSLVVGGKQASAAEPMSFELATPCDGIVDSSNYGYIDLIEVVAFPTTGPGGLPKMSDGTVPKITIPGTTPIIGIYNAYLAWDGATNPAPNTVNSLSGFGELDIIGADYATFFATAFQDYKNQAKVSVLVETLIGDSANNNLCEVEGALAKDALVLPYYDSASAATLPILTFPTKLAACPSKWPLLGTPLKAVPYAQGPYFDSPKGGPANNFDPIYSLTYYDKEEHTFSVTCTVSPCPENPELDLEEEVNFVFLNSPFDAGWARAVFGDHTTCGAVATGVNVDFYGAPVIPWLVHFTADGFSMVPAAYSPKDPGYNDEPG